MDADAPAPAPATPADAFVVAAARAAFASGVVTLTVLAALHVLSPEFDPSWRMVSEYANGSHHWAITLFFASWSGGTFALAAALWRSGGSRLVRAGAVFLVLAGVGEAMGAAFDINHPGHGAAFGLGVPTVAIGAVLAGVGLSRRDGLRGLGWFSQAPWLAIVLMGASFGLLFSSAKAAGIELTPGKPWNEVPAGVTAVMGWANRLLVVVDVAWALVVARHLSARSGARLS